MEFAGTFLFPCAFQFLLSPPVPILAKLEPVRVHLCLCTSVHVQVCVCVCTRSKLIISVKAEQKEQIKALSCRRGPVETHF